MKNNLNPIYVLTEQYSDKKILKMIKNAGYKDIHNRLKGGLFKKQASKKEILDAVKDINKERKIDRIRRLFQDQRPVSIPEKIRYTPEETDYLVDLMKKRHPRSFFKDVVAKGHTGTKRDAKGIGPDIRASYMNVSDGPVRSYTVTVPDVIEDWNGLRKHGFEFGSNWKRLKKGVEYDPKLDIENLRKLI